MLPFLTENEVGVQRKLLHTPLLRAFLQVFLGKHQTASGRMERKAGARCSLTASCIPLQGIEFVSCLLFSRECSNLEAFQLSAN